MKGGDIMVKKVVETISSQVKEMAMLVQECEDDAKKFDDGVRGAPAAGARIRKQMQLIKSLAQGIRQSVQETKHARVD